MYILTGLILLALFVFVFAWWSNESDRILLSHYGYDFDAMNDFDRFKNVSNANMEKVKSLEIGIMGIGWPLQAIFTFIFLTPYLFLVYILGFIMRKLKNK